MRVAVALSFINKFIDVNYVHSSMAGFDVASDTAAVPRGRIQNADDLSSGNGLGIFSPGELCIIKQGINVKV